MRPEENLLKTIHTICNKAQVVILTSVGADGPYCGPYPFVELELELFCSLAANSKMLANLKQKPNTVFLVKDPECERYIEGFGPVDTIDSKKVDEYFTRISNKVPAIKSLVHKAFGDISGQLSERIVVLRILPSEFRLDNQFQGDPERPVIKKKNGEWVMADL